MMPMIKVGIATMTAEIRRSNSARCSTACIAFLRSSSDKAWATLTCRGGEFAEAIAAIMCRRVREGSEGV